MPRTIDCVDIAHLGGTETVGSLVTFIDGLPFKPGYRRYKIKSVAGSTISPRSARWSAAGSRVSRNATTVSRYLLDRRRQGPAQRRLAGFRALGVTPPTMISLAKREEEIYVPGRSDPIVLSRRSFACGCSSMLATRPTASPSITTTCCGRNGRLVKARGKNRA